MINTMIPPILWPELRRRWHTDWRDRRRAKAAFHRVSDRLLHDIGFPEPGSVDRDPLHGRPNSVGW